MATSSNELNILITLTNQTKDSMAEILKGLGEIKTQVEGIGKGKGTEDINRHLESLGQHTEAIHEHTKHAGEGVHGLIERFDELAEKIKFFTGGFLGFEFIQMTKEIADVAARANTLAVSMQVVGTNAGYTTAELSKTDKAVQKLGITADSSRESITQLLQSGISLNFAEPLARASQNLAVISGQNSSETFKRLITNIQQLDTLGLRFMGIIIDREQVFAQAARETGKAITGQLEKTVFANAVLAESAKLAGLYTAAMNSAGKALTSLPRYIDNFKDALGQSLQPVYLQLIVGTEHVLEAVTEFIEKLREGKDELDLFGTAGTDAAGKMTPLAAAVKTVADHLTEFFELLAHHAETIKKVAGYLVDAGTAFLAFKAAGILLPLLTKGFTALSTVITAAASATGLLAGAMAGLEAVMAVLLGPEVALAGGALLLYAAFKKLTGGTDEAAEHAKKSGKELIDELEKQLEAQDGLIARRAAVGQQLQTASNRLAAASPDEKQALKKQVDAFQEESKRLEKIQDELGKAINKTKKEINENEDVKGSKDLQNRATALADASAQRIKLAQEEIAANTALGQTLQKAGSDFLQYTDGVSQKTGAFASAITDSLERLGRIKGSDINAGLRTSLEIYEKLADSINTQQGLAVFDKVGQQLIAAGKKFGVDVSGAVLNLRKKVVAEVEVSEQALSEGGDRVVQRQKALNVARVQLEQTTAQDIAALHKLGAEQISAIDKAFFDRGLEDLTAYYDARVRAASQAAQDSLAIELLAIKQLEVERAAEFDPEKRDIIDGKIRQAKERAAQIQARSENEVLTIQLEKENQRLTLLRQVQGVVADINDLQGNKQAAIRDRIEQQRLQELESVKKLGDTEATNLVNKKYELQLNKQLADERLAQLGRELDLRRSLLDLNDARAAAKLANGDITTLENQDKINASIRERIALLNREFDQTLLEREAARTDNRADDYDTYNKKLADLQKEAYSVAKTFHTVGDDIANSFTDAIASNFEAVLTRSKSFKQGFLDIFKDVNTQILRIFTREFAEKITQGSRQQFDALFGGGNRPQASASRDALIDKTALPKPAAQNSVIETAQSGILRAIEASAGSLQSMRQKLDDVVVSLTKFGDTLRQQTIAKVPKAIQPGTEVGQAGGPPLNQPFDFKTANKVIGRTDRPIAVPAYNEVFDQAAESSGLRKLGLDGDFLRYQALKESGFKTDAVSKSGAKGLMQMTPATFKGLGFDEKDIFDPEKSIQAAAKLMAQLMQQFNGDVDAAVAAYNAGPKIAEAIVKGDTALRNKLQSPENQAQTDDYRAVLGTNGIGGFGRRQEEAAKTRNEEALKEVEASIKSQHAEEGATEGHQKNKEAVDHASESLEKLSTSATRPLASSDVLPTAPLDQDALQRQADQQDRQSIASGPTAGNDNLSGAFNILSGGVGSLVSRGFGPFAGLVDYVFKNVFNADTFKSLGKGLSGGVKKEMDTVGGEAQGGGLGLADFGDSLGSSIQSIFKSLVGGGGDTGGGLGNLLGSFLGAAVGDAPLAFADGGMVSGPGSGTSDSIAAQLSNGEFVMPAKQTGQFLPLLESMRKGAFSRMLSSVSIDIPKSPAYAAGGLVLGNASTTSAKPVAPNVTINISTPDAGSFKKSQDQIAARMGLAVNRAIRRNN